MPRPFCSREESTGWTAAIGARAAQADLTGLWDRRLRGRPRRRPLVPGLTRGSRGPAAAGGRATGFWVWASAAAPASAALALEADTAARTAAAPGALCFLFLPPMLQRRRQTAPGAGPAPSAQTPSLFTAPGPRAASGRPPSGRLTGAASRLVRRTEAPPPRPAPPLRPRSVTSSLQPPRYPPTSGRKGREDPKGWEGRKRKESS